MTTEAITAGVSDWQELGFGDAPRRVVSLVPSVTESLFELGCGDRVVAVTDYCVHPADKVRALARVGGTKNPDQQRIRAALPDLIIANREENRREDLEALAADGYKVWVTFPCTVRQAIDLLWDFTRLFRVPHMGRHLAVLETAYEWASLSAENMAPIPVFCPIWREPQARQGPPRWWMTVHRDTYVHDILRICGAANIFADRERSYPLAADLGAAAPATLISGEPPAHGRDTRYPRVTPDEMAQLAPEVIMLPSEPYPFSEADLTAFDAYPQVPAVKNKRIYLVDGSLLTWHGTRLAKALADLPALISAGSPSAAGSAVQP